MYDYVIVGAGSAGCVLAGRLSEDPDVRVALVEAGGADGAEEIHVPVAFGALFKGRHDWDLQTEPEPGLGGRRAYLPRGKVLGGCSSINAMVYIRGHRADYDEWAADGATGWAYDDVLPHFRRAEDNERGEDAYHGVGGPLAVSDGRSGVGLTDAFVEACVQAGHPHNPDFNGAEQLGAGRFQVTQRNGMRCSAAVAYVHPALARPNLEVIVGRAGAAGAPRRHARGGRGDRAPRGRGAAARRARGHRQRRRVRVAAGAHALGHRPRRRARAARHRGGDRPPGRPRAAGPPDGAAELADRRGVPADGRHAGQRGAPALRGARAADVQRRRGGRVPAYPRRPRRTRRGVPFRPGAVLRRGAGRAARPRLRLRSDGHQADEPRARDAAHGRPGHEAADPATTTSPRPRTGRAWSRACGSRSRSRRSPRCGRSPERRCSCRSPARTGPARVRPPGRADRLPPDVHLRDRVGRRQRAARARRRGAAGRRHLRHALRRCGATRTRPR